MSRNRKSRASRKSNQKKAPSAPNPDKTTEGPATDVKDSPAPPRARKIGQGPECQMEGCDGDLFVTQTVWPYPHWMEKPGYRHFQCGKCQNRSKEQIPSLTKRK